ncbi:hypothetical protein BD309DRAFT_818660, partial [Dichomitus squalens]
IKVPPPQRTWVVVWGKENSAPEFYLFNLAPLDHLDDDNLLTLPWAHLFADAPYMCIWRKTETSWVGVRPGQESGVWPAPVTLLAHPFTSILAGSGEAIAWLENWCL